jgi:hypothetical protein
MSVMQELSASTCKYASRACSGTCLAPPPSLTLPIQLIRVECCKSEQGDATDSSEIQALQVMRIVLSSAHFDAPFRSLTAMLRTA